MKWDRAKPPEGADRDADIGPPDVPFDRGIDPDRLAPSGWHRTREVFWHLPRMLSGLGPVGPRGPAKGPPVLVLPGFLATDRTTMDLRRALARAGWRAHPWGLGINRGAQADTLELLERRIEAVGEGQPVLLVGWSLGGLFAREVAHRVPGRVRAVVTLGSPFAGDLKTNTNVTRFYEWVAGHDVNEPPFPRLGHEKPPVPTLAIWSSKDGIVAPHAARGGDGEVDKAVEIDTHHMGMAIWRPALSRIVEEIRTFLTEAEGRPPIGLADGWERPGSRHSQWP